MHSALEPYPPLHHDDSTTRSGDFDDPSSIVAEAIGGSQCAWRELYRRYDSLISTTARQFRLSASNVEDVSQTVWLQLVKHLKNLREPRALPGWIVTTTRNEALRVVRSDRRCELADPLVDRRLHQIHGEEPDVNLDQMERAQALHAVIGQLRPQHQALFRLLLAEPQVPYSEISRRLGIPIGSIGPTRARCLARLRGSSALHAVGPAALAA